MKAPIRLAVLTITTILFIATITSHHLPASYQQSSSRLLLRSRGYLPSTLLSWTANRSLGHHIQQADTIQKQQDVVVVSVDEALEKIKSEEGVISVVELEELQKKWPPPDPNQGDKIVVMGKMHEDYTDWVEKEVPDWQRAIYHIPTNTSYPEDPANLSPGHFLLQANKGREALTYLTYILQNYHSPYLPSTMLFIHPHRDGYPRAWHTDAPGHSAVSMLQTLRLDHVQQVGYTNLRCNGNPGCPAEVRPLTPQIDKEPESHMAAAWVQIFPDRAEDIPRIIAAPCCAQFAVSKEQLRKRPYEDYQRIHDWIMTTELSDYVSGRVMEYLWHILFGQEAVHCPENRSCLCSLYGRKCRSGQSPTLGMEGLGAGVGVGLAGNLPPMHNDGRPRPMSPTAKGGLPVAKDASTPADDAAIPSPPAPFTGLAEIEEGELEVSAAQHLANAQGQLDDDNRRIAELESLPQSIGAAAAIADADDRLAELGNEEDAKAEQAARLASQAAAAELARASGGGDAETVEYGAAHVDEEQPNGDEEEERRERLRQQEIEEGYDAPREWDMGSTSDNVVIKLGGEAVRPPAVQEEGGFHVVELDGEVAKVWSIEELAQARAEAELA